MKITVVEDAVAGATDQSKDVALTKLTSQDISIFSSAQIFESENNKGVVFK